MSSLIGELTVEDEWFAKVMPSDVKGSLLLPARSFVTSSHYEHMWGLAAEAANAEQIRGAVNAIANFTSAYAIAKPRQPPYWQDEVSHCYKLATARHGVAVFPRNWKYSFVIPNGFHYDVTNALGRDSFITDGDGERHSIPGSQHVNIDAHGVVR